MRLVVQRVESAKLSVNDEIVSQIGNGLAILIGVENGDEAASAVFLAGKVARLRIFADENGKMNKSVLDVDGEILVISQFTLFADWEHGNRPGFSRAESPERANELYLLFSDELRKQGVKTVRNGVFGADMHIAQIDDGPVTIIMDRKEH